MYSFRKHSGELTSSPLVLSSTAAEILFDMVKYVYDIHNTRIISAIRTSHPAKGVNQPLLRALWRPWTLLWLSLPMSIRSYAYSVLWQIGTRLYPDGEDCTQALPFGLFAKRALTEIARSAAQANIHVAMNTTIPVPTILDFLEGKKYSLTIMTRLPGESMCEPMLSGQISEEYFETTMRDWFTQLRNLPPPDPMRVTNFDGGMCHCFRVTGDQFGPFPDIPSFHEQLLRMCPFSDQERLRPIAAKVYNRSHRILFAHGDIHVHNILTHKGRLTGLVDWDCAGWYPEYWDYVVAIYHIKQHPFWVDSLSRIFPQYQDELEIEREIWKVHFPW
ncbi:hypothetical protein QCA50_008632 [Cerrena zonata]|uniref:Aminoglycoside phosphotransferase domain-containing protein n=1 Tax=Cerrena zonata TaxID=2478898 RepID=A0AAW0G9S8_9APHY